MSSSPLTPVDDRSTTGRQRPVSAVGPGLLAAQISTGSDCLIALVIGLIGGILAGIALSRARIGDQPGTDPPNREWTPPTVETGSVDGDAFEDDPALTDEERVVRLLSANDGRMKQSRIVEKTGWSKAKVSRLLSSMADHDQITKLTIGRENIIFLGADDDVYVSGNRPNR